jgi:hypothetical protein
VAVPTSSCCCRGWLGVRGEALPGTGALFRDRFGSRSLRLAQLAERDCGRPGLAPPLVLLDRQGWSTLFAGSLLLLISFTTNYGDDNLFQFRHLPAHD